MTAPHNHELDDRLHDGCDMCDLIKELVPKDRRERAALAALDAHTDRAAKAQVER